MGRAVSIGADDHPHHRVGGQSACATSTKSQAFWEQVIKA